MNAKTLLDDLRSQDIHLQADGLTLHVDVPSGADTGELRLVLHEHKRALIRHLERERRRLEEAGRRGFVIKWSREPGYISLHDPITGEWHEVTTTDCPPWVLEDAKAHRRRSREKR